jgi:hypothetical protein
MGRFDQALARAREGVGINPLGAPEQYLVGWVHFRARRYHEAAEQLGWTRAQWPDYPWTSGSLAASQLFGGRPAAAIETCRDALTTPNIPTCLAYIVATLGRAGAVAEARRAMELLEDIDRTSYLDPYPLAVAYAGVSSSLLPSTSFGETMWVVALRSRSNVRSHPASASPRPSGHAPGPIPLSRPLHRS